MPCLSPQPQLLRLRLHILSSPGRIPDESHSHIYEVLSQRIGSLWTVGTSKPNSPYFRVGKASVCLQIRPRGIPSNSWNPLRLRRRDVQQGEMPIPRRGPGRRGLRPHLGLGAVRGWITGVPLQRIDWSQTETHTWRAWVAINISQELLSKSTKIIAPVLTKAPWFLKAQI